MSKIIDGRALALEHEKMLQVKLGKLDRRPSVVSVLASDDSASLKYSEMKEKKAAELGIGFEIVKVAWDQGFEDIAQMIMKFNRSDYPDGLMIQLPIEKSFLGGRSEGDLLQMIDPRKDVDGLSGKGPFLPATIRGVLSILEVLGNLNGKVFAVAGSEGNIGKSMTKVFLKRGYKVVKVDKKNPKNSLKDLSCVDIVVSCAGVSNLIKPHQIKRDSILIDVGLGDFDPRCFEKSSAYTPKIGGVGPMTIISLMENVVKSVEGI